MKKRNKIILAILSVIITLSTSACSAKNFSPQEDGILNGFDSFFGGIPEISPEELDVDSAYDEDIGNEAVIAENPFIKVSKENVSTFSADVDTASYTFLRKLINQGYKLEEIKNIAKANVLRTEEMVNYFDYDYAGPAEGDAFGVTASIAKAPWNNDTYLMTLGLKAKELETKTANNLVFLIDVSGSMNSSDKLPLLQQAFVFLTEQLNENDTVSIVTYSGEERVVLNGESGNKKEIIIQAINSLKASGSTNGEAGIKMAYRIAEENFKEGGNNRIIIASDGDLNVGISNPDELEKLVEEKRKSGVFLSVLGFGNGNFRDDNMSAIAQTGNGVYHYIDCAAEAERIFTDSLLSTIYTVAKDVKFQLTFDEKYISEYRLIGYENRLLSKEDFDDDTKDAGEVGSGHTITVCYELKLTEEALADSKGDETHDVEDWIKLAIRYKEPNAAVSLLDEYGFGKAQFTDTPDEDFIFASTVIEFSMLIRNSKYAVNDITLDSLTETLEGITLDVKKAEFKALLEKLS